MMKPYAINRVSRSKSNGGGRPLEGGIRSPVGHGFFLSSSCISIERKSSLCTPPA